MSRDQTGDPVRTNRDANDRVGRVHAGSPLEEDDMAETFRALVVREWESASAAGA